MEKTVKLINHSSDGPSTAADKNEKLPVAGVATAVRVDNLADSS